MNGNEVIKSCEKTCILSVKLEGAVKMSGKLNMSKQTCRTHI